jgi:CheY-like chemotaxis protein
VSEVAAGGRCWKVLVVDDEPDVVEVTAMVFDGVEFEGVPVQVLRAASGAQASALFDAHPDIAVAYIDVVMETERAGLDLVGHVRDQLRNGNVRLILRTGNPGLAAREEIVRHLEIDDYREKPELTAERLETSLITALRTYKRLCECAGVEPWGRAA